jgi:hypothetical protein
LNIQDKINKIIYAQQDISLDNKSVFFLVGPTPRSEGVMSWRPKVLKMINQSSFNGTILIPEFKSKDGFTKNFAYDKQIEWELSAMEKADKIIFWIDRHLPNMPTFTTNTEFGYWVAKQPSKIILGIPESSEKCDYIKYLAIENNIVIHETFDKIISDLSNI